jgi:hypothetical protein
MDSPRFQRNKEDFTCEHCGAIVAGTGYTNHCPKCLYSKHVDVNPGDRAASCGGLMEPIRIEGTTGKFRIIHKCMKCGLEKPNAVSEGDDPEAVIRCAQRAAGR